MTKMLYATLGMIGLAFTAIASPPLDGASVFEFALEHSPHEATDLTVALMLAEPIEMPTQVAILEAGMIGYISVDVFAVPLEQPATISAAVNSALCSERSFLIMAHCNGPGGLYPSV